MSERRQLYNRWCEVDAGALKHNLKELRRFLAPAVKIMAVVKANGYGCGISWAAAAFTAAGADMLAVTTLDEGLTLRRAGITAPCLVMLPLLPDEAFLYEEGRLIPTLTNITSAQAWAAQARAGSACHIKLNTGMNRIGTDSRAAVAIAREVTAAGLLVDGVYSHLATASSDKKQAKIQLAKFKAMTDEIKAAGIDGFQRHIAASSAICSLPEAHLDMVRAGSLLYGQSAAARAAGLDLKEPWELKARIVDVQQVKKGEGIGYGFDFHAPKNMRIGVIPLGYCDGLAVDVNSRSVSMRGALRQGALAVLRRTQPLFYAGGQRLPLAGRVAMQSIILDISSTSLQVGDTVSIKTRRALVSPLIARVYLEDGRIIGYQDTYENAAGVNILLRE